MQVTEPSNMHYGLFLQLSLASRKINNKVLVGLFTLQIHHIYLSSFARPCKQISPEMVLNVICINLHLKLA